MAPLLSTLTQCTLLVWLAAGIGGSGGSGGSGPPSWGSPGDTAGTTSEPVQQGNQGNQGTSPECSTPRAQAGHCIRLQSCKPLLDLLKSSRYNARGLPDVDVTLLLRRSHCGFRGNTVMVCCPDDTLDGRYRPTADTESPPASNSGYAPPESSLAFSASPPAAPLSSGSRPSPSDFKTPSHAGAGESAWQGQGVPEFMSLPLDEAPTYDRTHAARPARPARPSADGQLDYPATNLALLPTEMCGLRFHQHPTPHASATNRSGLMQHPWVARIGYRQGDSDRLEYLCSGSLISERYILTAAHCIDVHNGPVSVRLGELDSSTDPDCVDSACAPSVVDVAVEEKVVHDAYQRGLNDIALLRLARPVAFSEAVSPICLPLPVQDRSEGEDLTGRTMTVAGWGNTSPNRRQNSPSRWLLQFPNQVTTSGACHSAYDALDDVRFDAAKQLCVVGGCQGDSGSPLMSTEDVSGQRVLLHGVLSYGLPDCALRNAPLVFARVSHYAPWVLRNLKPNPFVPKDRSSGSGLVDPRDATSHY